MINVHNCREELKCSTKTKEDENEAAIHFIHIPIQVESNESARESIRSNLGKHNFIVLLILDMSYEWG